jgi:hypothetical protein
MTIFTWFVYTRPVSQDLKWKAEEPSHSCKLKYVGSPAYFLPYRLGSQATKQPQPIGQGVINEHWLPAMSP